MFALTLLLMAVSMVCIPIGLVKFPWEARTFREMSEEQWGRFWKCLGLTLIPLSLTALCVFGTFALIS